MATWRCPNCRTVQADSPVCFLCRRSARSCGTCVNFRSSLVGGVGFCGLDRRRHPLSGDERRECWSAEALPVGDFFFAAHDGLAAPGGSVQPARRGRFVEPKPVVTRPITGR